MTDTVIHPAVCHCNAIDSCFTVVSSRKISCSTVATIVHRDVAINRATGAATIATGPAVAATNAVVVASDTTISAYLWSTN